MGSRLNKLTSDVWADAVRVDLTRAEIIECIHRALEVTGGRRLRAARILRISERTINRYIGPKPGRWPLKNGTWITHPEPKSIVVQP